MEEVRQCLALKMVEGVGDVNHRSLIEAFGDAESVFKASESQLRDVKGIGEKLVEGIRAFSDWKSVDEEIEKAKKLDIDIITLADTVYPRNLLETYSPPPVLYKKGAFKEEDIFAVSVVGSRTPDRYGKVVAETLGRELGGMGITVISGMARGIDSIAHIAALRIGGRTIAVLGSGLDVVYPPENRALYREIVEKGVVLSEFPLGTTPDSNHFPKRNRVISGLALGVVVVQAAQQSGSLITAASALEQNREVFAIPGNITKPLGKGTNDLIKRGAKLVETVDDIIEEIEALRLYVGESRERGPEIKVELTTEEKAVCEVLKNDSLHIDDISRLSEMETSKVLSLLMGMELKGVVIQHSGKIFEIKIF